MKDQEDSISSRDCQRLCRLIHAKAGIVLGSEKKTMLEARLRRRLKDLTLGSFGEYCDYLFGKEGMRDEIAHLIDVVTTNKTDFFREQKHFDFLAGRALPEFAARNGGRNFVVWSAGCSSGEEPYTLAIVLSEYARTNPGFRFRILASDISTAVLEKAKSGIYAEEVVKPVTVELRRRYFMRSRDPLETRTRVVPELRHAIEFRHLNFMDSDYGLAEKMDAIFCRNVLIYFNRASQEQILRKLTEHLLPGGYLFVGHAETLHGMDLPLTPAAPSLYRRVENDS